MTEVRLSRPDAARLAGRFGRGVEEFESVDGMTVVDAASHLGLSPEALLEALGKNAVREPVSGAKRTEKKAAKKAKAK